MELVWEDPPVPEGPFFTKDAYDKYSLAPNVRELWAFLQSPSDNAIMKPGCDKGAAKASCSSSSAAAGNRDDSFISKEEPCWDGHDDESQCADNAAEDTEDSKDTKKSKAEHKQVKIEADVGYPEPRLPYPCVSSLSSKHQENYLGFLMSKKEGDAPQWLKEQVDNEVMQFMRYLQDVAKICAEDYAYMSMGAIQYFEDYFMSCSGCIKTFPQFYKIHEVTSLTGGTFNPRLKLTFEKQLLIMGNVDITDHAIVPADAQLASDYQSVSSENPPAKKAKDMHATISGDSNAVTLCDRYEPHVCLTRDALFRLLDNHGPDFGEQWELPVLVKLNPGKGSSQKKTVYIDPPFLKTEMTMREKSHIYHEESLKLSIKRSGSKNVFHLMTELSANEPLCSPERSKRNVVSLENSGLDFDVDLTDLETFGETKSTKTTKMQKIQNEPDVRVKSRKATCPSPLNTTNKTSDNLIDTCVSSQEEINSSLTEGNDVSGSKTIVPKVEPMKPDSAQESKEDIVFAGDSDDEKLFIDDSVSPTAVTTKQPKPKTTPCSADSPKTPVCDSISSVSPSPQKVVKLRRSKRGKVSNDQLGEILQMQTAMFNSANDSAKGSTSSQETNSPARCTGPPVYSHPTSLVKPCVSSYLERNQNPDAENFGSPHESAPVTNICTENKKILPPDLQAGAEDEQDYEAPEEGNLLYKLYSLQDLLLLVRSSVSLTHTRRVGNSVNQHVPVHVLPKLEYQLSYGVECLSSSETCQLWTETALHSSTVSYIAHINAHTSKVALLRKLPDDWKQNISCGFKPSKSLNILHHLLKKLTGLDEGQYLIAHKAGEPFVTLLKAANGKVSRGAYNLQQAHSSVPQPPTSAPMPWIPVDPSVVLPFHQKHGRVPCTFPPQSFIKTGNDGPLQCGGKGPGNAKRKNKKKKNRAAKRDMYIKNLIKKSV